MSEPFVHIHAPAGVYIGQRKQGWARTWETVTPELETRSLALSCLAMNMEGYKFGRVIFCAEYYDPNVVAKISQ